MLSGTSQTDILKNVQQIKFADQDASVDQTQPVKTIATTKAMALENVALPLSAAVPTAQKGVTVVYDLNSHLTDEISALYELCFDRFPDAEGLRFWESTIEALGNNELALLKVAQSFLVSDEYMASHNGLSNKGFVDQLYVNAFERSADMEGRTFWLNALDNKVERAHILQGFAGSVEMISEVGQHSQMDLGFWCI